MDEIGACEITRIDRPEHADFVIRVDRADPRIEITDELLSEIFNTVDYQGTNPPWMSPRAWIDLDYKSCDDHNWACPSSPGICYRDGLLHIDGVNRHVVYLIGDYVPERNTWLAVWPD